MKEYSMILTENLQDVSLDYDELTTSVKELTKMHTELEINTAYLKSPLAKTYAKIKRAIGAAPRYTVEEVLSVQLMIIRQLRKTSESQALKTRVKLDKMVFYAEESDLKILEGLNYRESSAPNLEKAKQEIIEIDKTLEKLKIGKSEEGYIKKKHEKNKLMRAYLESSHLFDLASESAFDLFKQNQYLELQENVIRNTVYTAERLAEKTKRIENQITLIKGIYDSVLKQQKLYTDLYRALTAQREYIKGLDNILVFGQQTMASISSRSETLNSFYENPNTENLMDLIETSDQDRRSDLELKLEEHFPKKKKTT